MGYSNPGTLPIAEETAQALGEYVYMGGEYMPVSD